jgi:hypothetical protein
MIKEVFMNKTLFYLSVCLLLISGTYLKASLSGTSPTNESGASPTNEEDPQIIACKEKCDQDPNIDPTLKLICKANCKVSETQETPEFKVPSDLSGLANEPRQ